MDPQKVVNWKDLCKKFLNRYSYNPSLTIMVRDRELLKQETKEG